MNAMHNELPHPGQVLEEPVRPLLVLVDCAVEALQVALDAEHFEPLCEEDPDAPPADLACWSAQILCGQIEAMRTALANHERALKYRNDPARRVSPSSSDDDIPDRQNHALFTAGNRSEQRHACGGCTAPRSSPRGSGSPS